MLALGIIGVVLITFGIAFYVNVVSGFNGFNGTIFPISVTALGAVSLYLSIVLF